MWQEPALLQKAWKKEPDPIVDVVDARILAMFGDKITTDFDISPATGSIKLTSPAGTTYLSEHQGAPGGFQPVRHAAQAITRSC